MGHSIHYAVYDENVNRARVQAEWNEYAAKEDWQEGCSGLPSSIKWKNKICANYEEAEEYIKEVDSGWYDQVAVRFYSTDNLISTKTYEIYKERYERHLKNYNDLSQKIHYKGAKSAFISCRNCNSKINSSYFGKTVNNTCPICRHDLRPESTLDRIQVLKDNLVKYQKDLQKEKEKAVKRQKKNLKIKWLVKIEYHV